MKFLIDENFPRSAVGVLEDFGHEAIFIDEVGDFGDEDEKVFSAAQRLGAVILTSDRDFYHTVPLLHPTHFGIVVISLRQPNRRALLDRLRWFLSTIALPIDNRAFAIRDKTYCVRCFAPD